MYRQITFFPITMISQICHFFQWKNELCYSNIIHIVFFQSFKTKKNGSSPSIECFQWKFLLVAIKITQLATIFLSPTSRPSKWKSP